MIVIRRNMLTAILLILIFQIKSTFAQENQQSVALENSISIQPFEKTYLSTDKDFYFNNETIWLQLYLLNGSSHLNSEKSQVAYIELLDDKDSLVIQKKVYVENRGAQSHISLNKAIKPGIYTLQAYSFYMLNESNPVIFEKEVTISQQKSKILEPYKKQSASGLNNQNTFSLIDSLKVVFYPEGGHLVNSLETFVGFSITDKMGKGVATEGKIVDDENRIISFFKSQEFGLGKFKISPKVDTEYFAIIADSLKFPLPKTLSKGYVLSAKNKGDLVELEIVTNISKGLEGAYILGHLRGQIVFKQKIPAKKSDNSYRIRFLTDGLQDGVAHFTLFKASGEPVCKRLVYIYRSDNDINLTLNTNRDFYNPREQVSLKIKLEDIQGKPLEGIMSMAVTSAERLNSTTQSPSVESWLSLNSDIRSSIADPGFFFKENSFRRNFLLDIIMIANDGESVSLKREQSLEKSDTISEKGIMIKGSIVDFKTKTLPKEGSITLNLLGSADGPYSEEQVTNTNGKFSFGPFVFQDTLKAILKAQGLEKRKNGKSKKLAILIEEGLPFKREILKNKRKNRFVLQEESDSRPIQLETTTQTADFQIDDGTIELDEALIVEKKKTRQDRINIAFKKLNPLYSNPQRRIFMDSLPYSNAIDVFDVLRKFPGARVMGSASNPQILLRLRYDGPPLFVLDGVITTPDIIQHMNTAEIEFIDVLDQSSAGAYVSGAANGVVVVYTKGSLNLPTKNKPKHVPNINGFELVGFSKTRDFPVTDYSNEKLQNTSRDNRSTLYWKTNILFGESVSNDSDISFYTNDLPGSYIIKVEGVTADGRPFSAAKVIEVRAK